MQSQTQLIPELYHGINTYYASIDKVLSKPELRFGRNNLCFGKYLHSETPDRESFSRVAKFYKIDGKPSRKCTESFRSERGLGHNTLLFQNC